jgi:hypothetical protein
LLEVWIRTTNCFSALLIFLVGFFVSPTAVKTIWHIEKPVEVLRRAVENWLDGKLAGRKHLAIDWGNTSPRQMFKVGACVGGVERCTAERLLSLVALTNHVDHSQTDLLRNSLAFLAPNAHALLSHPMVPRVIAVITGDRAEARRADDSMRPCQGHSEAPHPYRQSAPVPDAP